MANERRVLRKLRTPHKLTFDDKLWPVNIAIMVLVAFLAGIVIVRFSEGTGHVSLFGWSMIAALFALAALTMWLLRYIHQRLLHRGMQLATVLSLMTHAVFLLVMATWPIASRVAEPHEPKQPILTVAELVVPRLNDGEQRKPDFLRPVETKTPETRSSEWTRTIASSDNLDPKLQRSFLSDDRIRPQPSVSPHRQPAETAPHEAVAESILSRRESNLPRVASEPVDAPDVPPRVDESLADQLVPQPTTPSRTSEEPQLAGQEQQIETTAPASEPTIAIQRQSQPTPSAQDLAEHSRNKSRPANPPLISETMVVLMEQASEATPDAGQPPEDVVATVSEVQRQVIDVEVAENTDLRAAPAALETERQIDVVARRNDEDAEWAVEPVDRPDEQPRPMADPNRLRSQSQVAVGDAFAPSVLTADESQDANRPAPTALSRSVDGLTGIGDSPNLSHSSPARGGPSLIASASATRVKPTQNIPEGPAIQPSQAVDIPQLRAGVLRPSSVFQAQAVEVAVAYGSQHLDSLDATTAATVERDASDALPDELTASVGVGTVDLGVQRTVSEAGTGRAAGGGRSELNLANVDSLWKRSAQHLERSLAAVNPAPDSPSGASDASSQSVANRQQETITAADERTGPPQPTDLPHNENALGQDPQRQTVLVRVENEPGLLPSASWPGRQATSAVPAVATAKQAAWSKPETDTTGSVQVGFERAAPRDQRADNSLPALPQTAIDMPGPLVVPNSAEDVFSSPMSEFPLTAHKELVAEAIFIPQVSVSGSGGLSAEPHSSVGVSTRRANPDSELIALNEHRFVVRDRGGQISLGGVDKVAAPAFSKRMSRTEGRQLGSNPGQEDARIDEAVELGLVFLARHQSPHGNWSLHHFASGKPYQDRQSQAALHADSAATGLALLAFLGAGYHHQNEKYNRIVQAGVQSLLQGQQENGNLFVPEDETSNQSVALYSHGIASIALCEAYGMSLDSELREPVQRALDFVVATQHPRRGGWRYQPRIGSDTSVTGWMMMALKSGQMAHLVVPAEAWAGLEHFMGTASASDRPYLFRYNPYAPETSTQRHGRFPTDPMTSVGLLIRIYTGSRRDDKEMILGAEYLAENLPSIQNRDTYYWYYATQIMFHMGGKYWEMWKDHLFPMLADSQITEGPLAGSWDPHRPIRDKWARHGGRLYVTTMNLLSLEVAYRHLPIYEEVSER